MTHSLHQMKHLEDSKSAVGLDDRREDSIVACRALFDRIDVDGSGTLDRNEIAMLATKMVHQHFLCHHLLTVASENQHPLTATFNSVTCAGKRIEVRRIGCCYVRNGYVRNLWHGEMSPPY